jgi:DNA-binding MarR family transcriptional regulator
MSLIGYNNIALAGYLIKCSLAQRKILHFLLKHRNASNEISFYNKEIAHAVGFTTKTVLRATKKFHEDGLITKIVQSPYCLPNIYHFNDTFF